MEAEKPICKLIGTDGNIFAIIAKVSKTLKRAELRSEATEFLRRVKLCQSYDEVLNLTREYVEEK